MKKIAFLLLFFCGILSAQVGINTVSPSAASVLHLESLNGSGTHGGFMPPKVDLAQRALIPVTVADDGMMIFLSDGTTRCVQVYNATDTAWVDFYCMPVPFVEFKQDFDSNTNWSYSVSPSLYNAGGDIWDVVNSLTNITNLTDNFLGCLDLNNANGGGNFFHEIAFVNVDVSNGVNVKIAFDYDIDGYDDGDDVQYEVFFDDVGQGVVLIIDGTANLTTNGTEVIAVPGGTTNVRLTLGIKQNGSDHSGFDNFRVYE